MSMFDDDTFLGTKHSEEIDTKFYLCPEGDYLGQCIELRARDGVSDKVPVTWANLDLIWEIKDDNVKTQLNMDKVVVAQQMFVDLILDSNGAIALPVRPDWGMNKNRDLKRAIDATGVKKTNFSINDLKFQTAWLKIKHEVDKKGATNADGTPVKYVRVAGVAPVNSRR